MNHPEGNDVSDLMIFNAFTGSSAIFSPPTIDSFLQEKRIIQTVPDANGTLYHLII
jgi:hypothetical protein